MRSIGSLATLAWVLRIQDHEVGDSALRTLAIMADFAESHGMCWAHIDTLAEQRGVSKATVYRHLKALHKHRYILPGDERLVEKFPADRRPRVWFMNSYLRETEASQVSIDDGVAILRPRDGDGVASGETDGVASGATTEHRKNAHKNKTTQVVTKSRAGAWRAGLAVFDGRGYPGRECVHDFSAETHVNSRTGAVEPLCPMCRRIGTITPKGATA